MRKPFRLAGILAILAAPLATRADEPPLPNRTLPEPVPPVISTHQIDRYDAIHKLQQSLKSNPRSLADWVILGELAHEVALDAPGDQAPEYYRMSRDAYEKALVLSPDNPGLKAAVQFARDQEANSSRFEAARDQASTAYIDARRRDLAATNYTPSLRVFGLPAATSPMTTTTPTTSTTAAGTTAPVAGTGTTTPGRGSITGTITGAGVVPPGGPATAATTPAVPATPAVPGPAVNGLPGTTASRGAVLPDTAPAETNAPSNETASANLGTRQIYANPIYQPYYAPQGTPYTFQQYSNSYYIPNAGTNPYALPMTMQRYLQQVPARALPSSVR